jgi:GTP cyclohydrolase IA
MVSNSSVTVLDLNAHHASPDADPGRATAGQVDRPRAEGAVRELLLALGRDPDSAALHDTPRRVAAAYTELLCCPDVDLTTFPNDQGYEDLVLARDIELHSLCEHHLLPITGVAHVGYLPGPQILGLSKLARVVEAVSRDLQIQERMTVQIANWLDQHLQPRGVAVVIEADHACLALRGIKRTGVTTITSALRGELREAPLRQEFLALVRPPR